MVSVGVLYRDTSTFFFYSIVANWWNKYNHDFRLENIIKLNIIGEKIYIILFQRYIDWSRENNSNVFHDKLILSTVN